MGANIASEVSFTNLFKQVDCQELCVLFLPIRRYSVQSSLSFDLRVIKNATLVQIIYIVTPDPHKVSRIMRQTSRSAYLSLNNVSLCL